jgi:hypothetical protein
MKSLAAVRAGLATSAGTERAATVLWARLTRPSNRAEPGEVRLLVAGEAAAGPRAAANLLTAKPGISSRDVHIRYRPRELYSLGDRMAEDAVTFEAVEALSEKLGGVICLIAGRRICIPRRYLVGTTIREPGDRGMLQLLRSVAASLGLSEP